MLSCLVIACVPVIKNQEFVTILESNMGRPALSHIKTYQTALTTRTV